MFITACNTRVNSPPNRQYTICVYTQKTRYQKLYGAIGEAAAPSAFRWIRHWARWLAMFHGRLQTAPMRFPNACALDDASDCVKERYDGGEDLIDKASPTFSGLLLRPDGVQ